MPRSTYTEDGQEDVDQEVGTAAALKEDAEGREDDGEDDLEDVAESGISTLSSRRQPTLDTCARERTWR